MEIAFVLGLLVLAIALFAWEVVSVDILTLLLLLTLTVSGILTPAEAFSGLSSEVIIVLASIFVMSGALQVTGVLNAVGSGLRRFAGNSVNRLLVVVMGGSGAVSGFMNNTTVTAMLLQPVISLARNMKVPPSRLLMPLAFASIMGGTCTLIGTSTNVAVSGYIARAGLQPLNLFEITPVGIAVLIVGTLYMLLVGQRLLPRHKEQDLNEEYEMREYLSEILVVENSNLIGQKIFESDLAKKNFRILKVIRGNEEFAPDNQTQIMANDVLLIEGNVKGLLEAKEARNVEIRRDLKLSDLDVKEKDIRIAEALLTPKSSLARRTLRETNFQHRFGLTVLAIFRHGQPLRNQLSDVRLRFGDVLLVQGHIERLKDFRRHPDLWILEEISPSKFSKRKGWYTVAFFTAAVVASAMNWLPLSVAILGAAVLTLLFRCLTVEEAYEHIDWRLLILIGGMTSYGLAMQKTHADEFLANGIVNLMSPVGVIGVMAGLFLLTVALTVPLSNAAAALVVLPVALQTATKLDADPRTFGIAIMLAASISFIGPFEPACLLVYGPGKYKFRDFVIIGAGLTLVLMVVVMILIPLLWPISVSRP